MFPLKLTTLFLVVFNFSIALAQYKTPLEKKGFYYLDKAKKFSKSNKDSIIFYLDKSKAIALDQKLDSLLFETYGVKINYYNSLREYKQSFFYCKQLDSLAVKKRDSIALFNAQISLGQLENVFDNTSKSFIHYKKALSIALKLKDNVKIAIAYGNIGNNYMDTGQYALANVFYLDCLRYSQKLSEKEKGRGVLNEAIIYTNLVFNYSELNDKQKAFFYLNKADKAFNGNYFEGKIEINELKGLTYANFKEYERAIYFFKKQLEISKARKDIIAIEHSLLNLAELYTKQKDFDRAIKYFDEYEKLDSLHNEFEEILSDNIQIYTIGVEIYKGANQYDKAFKYSELVRKAMDSLNKIEIEKAFVEYGKKFQTEKKIQENEVLKKENEVLKKENEIKILEVKQQKVISKLLILLSILGLILLVVIYSRFRNKKKIAEILEDQNSVISYQKDELIKINANKQKLFGIIAHDLVSPFNAILGYTQLLQEDYDSFTEEQRKEFIATINKYATNNYTLTRTLLDWAKVQQNRLVVNKTILNYKEIIMAAVQPYLVLADKKEIKVINTIADNFFVKADQNMMQTVIGNLFVNAIKFSRTGGTIVFNLQKKEDGFLHLEIEDIGLGMSEEQVKNLFNITKITSSKGTNEETGNGLGLMLCKELMELQSGKLKIYSQLNKGTKAVIII